MSSLSIALYFPFSRVKVTEQSVCMQENVSYIDIEPDERFSAVCHKCGERAGPVHSREVRAVRDLDFASAHVLLRLSYRKVRCERCQSIVVEDQELVDPCQRVTRRLALAIHQLCKVMTVSDVARHFDLDWKLVKKMDKLAMISRYQRRMWAKRALQEWCDIALEVGHSELLRFADTLRDHQDGILGHCEYPIHTGKLEGINNKVKVIKRKAYGFQDDRYFILKVIQAFDPKGIN